MSRVKGDADQHAVAVALAFGGAALLLPALVFGYAQSRHDNLEEDS